MATNWHAARDYVQTQVNNGIVVAPAAGQLIIDVGGLPPGLYDVQVAGSYGGTADAIDNMALFRADKLVTPLPVTPVANAAPIFLNLYGFVVYQGEHLTVRAIAAGGAGSVFRGTIIATPVRTQYGR